MTLRLDGLEVQHTVLREPLVEEEGCDVLVVSRATACLGAIGETLVDEDTGGV